MAVADMARTGVAGAALGKWNVSRAEKAIAALLVAWGLGLAAATLKLQDWQAATSRVLVTMQADALFQAQALRAGTAVEPAWYHQRTLQLLEAVELMQDTTAWTVVMPGSWRILDDLEERAAEHIGRTFGQMVTGTLGLALQTRAAALTGASLEQGLALDTTGDCQPPPLQQTGDGPTLRIDDMPEAEAMFRFLDAASRMDDAVRALKALRVESDPVARAQNLQHLVRYSLGAELSRPASRSLALLRSWPQGADPQIQGMVARLEWAMRCTATKGIQALQGRLAGGNAWLSIDDMMLRSLHAGLQVPAPPSAWPESNHRLRRALELMDLQSRLLARDGAPWMHPEASGFGRAHDRLLVRIEATRLLGPTLGVELRRSGRMHHKQLVRVVQARLEGPDAALAWHEGHQALGPSPSRLALRHALAALLDQPFMQAPAASHRIESELLQNFPPAWREAVSRHVRSRLNWLAANRTDASPAPHASWDSRGAHEAPASSAYSPGDATRP